MEMIKSQTSERLTEKRIAVCEELPPRRVRRYAAGLAQFLAVVAQFGLITLVVSDWQLETLSVSRLMDLAFVGFIIHHLLPFRFRLPFFAMLSLVAVVFGLHETGAKTFLAGLAGRVPLADFPLGNFLYRLIPGLSLVGVGLGLIGICHLPIPLGAGVAVLAWAGAGLLLLRPNSRCFLVVGACWRFWDRCSCS